MESQQGLDQEARVGEFRRRMVRHVQCRSCGYEPPRGMARPRCPKCGGGCWEKFVQVGKLRPDPPAVRAAQLWSRQRLAAGSRPAAKPHAV